MTLPLFPRQTEWVPPDKFPDLSDAKEIAIDLETCDPNMEKYGPGWPRNDGYIVGYAIAVDGWTGYFPVRHQGGGNLDQGLVERFIRRVLLLPADKVMHNAAYDCGWLMAHGYEIKGRILDTMIAAPLIDENRFSYSLNALGFDYLKEIKSEQALKDAASDFNVHAKKELWKLPAMFVGEYAEQDAALTLKLWQHFQTVLRKENIESIFDLETELLPILINLTKRGIRFDRDRAKTLIVQMQEREETLQRELKKLTGSSVEIWAAASIAIAFDKLKLPYPKSNTGLPSFTRSFLQNHEHPIAKLIIEARELNKTHGTFLQPYLDFSAADGRIHPHVNQLRSDEGGTVTGRLSMANPNLQQVPARHEVIGPMVRGLFLPEEGDTWAACDFSSQEPRILIHYASLLGLPGTEGIVDAYQKDPSTDFYQIVAQAANVSRKVAKTCIAEGQLVLTDRGLVPIEKIRVDDKVWDGVEWVSHEGVAFMGTKEVITHGNLTATPDHDVWTVQSGKIPFGVAASRLDDLVSTGNAEQAIQYVDRHESGDTEKRPSSIHQSALRLWNRGLEVIGKLEGGEIAAMPIMCYAGKAPTGRQFTGLIKRSRPSTEKSDCYFSTLQQPKRQGLSGLWRTWNNVRIWVDQRARGVSSYCGPSRTVGEQTDRPDRQQQGLQQRQHSLRHVVSEQCQQENHALRLLQRAKSVLGSLVASGKDGSPFLRIHAGLDNKACDARSASGSACGVQTKRYAKVYDILNAGPRHRFTVSGVLVSNCTLAIMYGAGKAKMAQQLDLPVDEAGELIQTFHTRVPFLKGTVDAVQKRIEHPASGGSIRTLLGRKCRFPLWEPTQWGVNKALPYEQAVIEYGRSIKRAFTYKGLNRLIQGSAADQTKAGMIALHKAGFNLLLQVHDEIALSVYSREEALEASEVMRTAVDLEVPSKVDVEIGPSWGEAA